jgi:hypothetical protein
MQTLSLSLYVLAFVLPPVAVVLGAAALAIVPSTARVSAGPPAPSEHVAV